jgi:hypothetical protein
MQLASAMADEEATDSGEPDVPPKLGAKNVARDPDLIKLSRSRPKVGALTAAGVVFLAFYFLVKLNPDRRFSGNDDVPEPVAVADLATGKIDEDAFVKMQGEPLMAHAVRAQTAKNSVGLRVVPVKGSSNRVWLVLPGDGWAEAAESGYTGRVRKLAELPFAGVIEDFLAAHPRPLFATAAAVRAGFGTGKVSTVAGDEIAVRDSDRVGFDVIDPGLATIVAAYNERLPDLAAWTKALASAGVTITGTGRDDHERAYFDVVIPGAVATVATKLEAANLWAARVDPVTHHHETTWGSLKTSAPAGFTITGVTIPDAQLDLIGLYVVRDVPSDAYALIAGERPQDYWYVLPVAIAVLLIGLLFMWALVRAIQRELPPRQAATQS